MPSRSSSRKSTSHQLHALPRDLLRATQVDELRVPLPTVPLDLREDRPKGHLEYPGDRPHAHPNRVHLERPFPHALVITMRSSIHQLSPAVPAILLLPPRLTLLNHVVPTAGRARYLPVNRFSPPFANSITLLYKYSYLSDGTMVPSYKN